MMFDEDDGPPAGLNRRNNARGGLNRRNRARDGNMDYRNEDLYLGADPYGDLLMGVARSAPSRINIPRNNRGQRGNERRATNNAGQNANGAIRRGNVQRAANNAGLNVIGARGRENEQRATNIAGRVAFAARGREPAQRANNNQLNPNSRRDRQNRNDTARRHQNNQISENSNNHILNDGTAKNLSNEDNKSNRGKNSDQPREFQIGFKFLQQTIEKAPAEILLVFSEKKAEFNRFFSAQMKPDLIILSVKLLTKICEPGFDNSKATILSSVCNSIFFVNTLKQYVVNLSCLHVSKRVMHRLYFENANLFWSSIVILFDTIINVIPFTACDRLYEIMKACNMIINVIGNDHGIDESVKTDFQNLSEKFDLCYEEKENSKKKQDLPREAFEEHYGDPPEDFRTISVYPKPMDILYDERVFLRPNITKGSYQSVDHYLDVQFRLLREDFICPLRDGISLINRPNDNKRKFNLGIRIYQKTKFISSYVTPNVVGVKLDFFADKRLPNGKLKRMRQTNWENSKRFMFGSLLCFTADKFETVIFATVAERKVDLLKEGYVIVKICDEYAALETTLYDQEFVMIENEVYFEPYYHVLRALQKLNEDNFPMVDYIVHVQADSLVPRYITNVTVYKYDTNLRIPVVHLGGWPTADQLKLNHSQYRAFQMALTKEFAIIQGPPGTGKTYLGLQIARTLLQNLSASKMLVVCYTNHALDQFLEGLLTVTKNMIRVGNRSKNEKLEQFNLSRNRGKQHRGFAELKFEIRVLASSLQSKVKDLQMLNDYDGIIDLTKTDVLAEFNKEEWFPKYPVGDFSRFLYWLLGFPAPGGGNKNIHDVSEQDQYIYPDLLSKKNDPHDEDSDYSDTSESFGEDEDDRFRPQPENDIVYDDISRISGNLKYAVSESEISEKIEELRNEIDNLEENYQQTGAMKLHQDIILKQQQMRNFVEVHEKMKEFLTPLKENKIIAIENAQNLIKRKGYYCTKREKLAIYLYCLNALKIEVNAELVQLNAEYREMYEQFEEQRDMNDLQVLQHAKVIGMTTTSAARMQSILLHLKIPIVIIEEAAEVPESHIIVSLTTHCEHLILIGDHQQLKPSTATYKLTKKYNLDISLFERMLNNGMHCARLDVQHRMRPEICQLISPNIYENLENHESVTKFPEVLGMKKSLFFVKHNVFEDNLDDDDNLTKKNSHEAMFLIRLCRYLILQGYDAGKITILTTYTGQMFLIKNETKNNRMLKEVKVTPVDNFQGEENDIILLSLVRSNKDAVIGFLKTENRVCVALSRAKIGLYIIGNMDNLMASSEIWPKINSSLQKMDAIGTHLVLNCQMHPDSETEVSRAEDFDNSPEGGCLRLCLSLLSCGHYCKSVCHITDRTHKKYTCKERCTKSCTKREHPCAKLCYQPCGDCPVIVPKVLKCGHEHKLPCFVSRELFQCNVLVKTILPHCRHEVMKPCFAKAETFPCTYPCENRLNCGHKCEKNCHALDDPDHINYKCHKPCTKLYKGCTSDHICEKLCFQECPPCSKPVKKKYKNCAHQKQISCSEDIEVEKCMKPCKRSLPCGHFCKLKCSEPCGNCNVPQQKIIPDCGHKIDTKCGKEVTRADCVKKCERKLLCGHVCEELCKNPCTTKCMILMKNDKIISSCGHPAYVPCSKTYLQHSFLVISDEYLNNCREKCGAELKCGHKCVGTCAACDQGRIHMPCMEPCGNTLICQHSCKVPCREYCLPCVEPCKYRCDHSKCSKKCGEPCVVCQEPCKWKCEHKKCSKKCGEICDRDGCDEPCLLELKCGHQCIGLCGEKCPTLCRICDEEEVTTIFFGNEDEPDARFVMLEECGHIFEAGGLDQWFISLDTGEEISPKHCPKCKTTINSTPRYATSCKQAYRSIMEVKLKVFGTAEGNEVERKELVKTIDTLKQDGNRIPFLLHCGSWKLLIEHMVRKTQLEFGGKLQVLSKIEFQGLDRMCTVMTKILKLYQSIQYKSVVSTNNICMHIEMILNSFTKVKFNLTEQFLDDINAELSRLHWIIELYKIESCTEYCTNKSQKAVEQCYEICRKTIMSVAKFTDVISKLSEAKLKDLLKAIKSSSVISAEDKQMILKAMDFAKSGHWYKCPNGHIYCITECGGAMQESNCPECGCKIGGSSHRLRADNKVATEMDGATRPAFSQDDFVYFPQQFV